MYLSPIFQFLPCFYQIIVNHYAINHSPERKSYQNKLLEKFGKEYADDLKEYYSDKLKNIEKTKEKEFNRRLEKLKNMKKNKGKNFNARFEKLKLELKRELDEKYSHLTKIYNGRIQSANRYTKDDELVE